MFAYRAYGLGIRSGIALPELPPAEFDNGEIDLIIRTGRVKHPESSNYSNICIHATAAQVYLHWRDVGTFCIQEGREIIIDRAPNVHDDILRLFILGSGLAVALHQQDYMVLHASAVAIDQRTAVFVGDKGWGKSTLSAALHARGHDLITDDLVAVDYDLESRPVALPGYPQFKLWPNTLESLDDNPEDLPRLRPELDKRAKRIESGFAQEALPLGCIYVLGLGEDFTIAPLPPQLALMHLIRHLYVARYGADFLQSLGNNQHLRQCAQLAQMIPVRHLKRKPDLSALADLALLVENDMAALAPEPRLP